MSVWIKQSTARTILVGPVLDSNGAAKTDEVVGSIKVTKNGTVGAANGSATLTHDHAGKYKLALTASDTDTLGVLEISLNSGTNDMPVARLNVVPANAYDSLVAGSDYLLLDAADTRAALGLASANLDTQLAAIVADTDEIQSGWAAVVASTTDTLAIVDPLGADWGDGGRLDVLLDAAKDNATTAVARLPTALVSGRMDANVGAMATDTISAAAVSAAAVTKIAAGVPTTGLKLAADGLDQISAANPTGAGTTFAEKMMRLYHRFFAKHRKTGNSIIVYRDDGTTPATTQAYTVVGDTETVEPPA